MPAISAATRFASGPAITTRQAAPGVSGSRSKIVAPPKSESAMERGMRPTRRPAIAWPTSWSASDVTSAVAVTMPVAQYRAALRPGAAAGKIVSAKVHALRPMARRHEMSGRTSTTRAATPPAARSVPMRGSGATRRATDSAIEGWSGGERVDAGPGILGADPHIGHGQDGCVLGTDEQGVGDVGVRHLLVH